MNDSLLTIGEEVKLNNGKTYFCLNAIEHESRYYVLLVTKQEPLEMCFAEQAQGSLRIVGSKEEKQYLKGLFEQNAASRNGGNDV
ncbi:hypothetical protein J6X15_04895 [Candidatus Saccharibacteria bacterium]|nr:hypothetical protein [Candidatus Saccharibacteria bacterium]